MDPHLFETFVAQLSPEFGNASCKALINRLKVRPKPLMLAVC